MSSGVQDASLTLVSRSAVLAIALAYQMCLAWLLGPAGLGSYAVCILFVTLLTVVVSFSCRIALEYFVASKRFSLSEGVTYGLVTGLIVWILAGSIGSVLMRFPLSFFSKASLESFELALILIPILFMGPLLLQLLCSIRQFRWFALFSVTNALLQLSLAFTFLKLLGLGVNGVLFATGLSSALTSLIILAYMRQAYRVSLVRPSLKSLNEIVHFGTRNYVGNLSNQVNLHVGTVILAFFASRADIGLFSLAAQITSQVEMIPDAVGRALMPRVATDQGGRRELVAQCSRVAVVLCGALMLVLVVFATPIIRILFSEAFLPIVPLIRILSIGVIIRCAAKVFVPYLIGTNNPGQASVAVAVGMVTNLTILWLLLPVYGLTGAAIAMAAGYLVSSLILTRSFTRISGLRLEELWRFSRSDWTALVHVVRQARRRLVV